MSANPDTAVQSGSGVPPLNAADHKRRDAASTLGHASQNTSSPEEAQEGGSPGGLGKAHQLFGEQLPKLLNELNEVLAA